MRFSEWNYGNLAWGIHGSGSGSFTGSYTGADGSNLFITGYGNGIVSDGLTITAGTITSCALQDQDGRNVLEISGFAPISAVTFFQKISDDNTETGRYPFLVSLLDSDSTSIGSVGSEHIELGSGNDTATGGDGDDTAFKWKSGDLNFDGGPGSDTLSFQAAIGSNYRSPHTIGATVDLTGGTGASPYGGILQLRNVENVVGTDHADPLTGSNADNVFGDGIYDIGRRHDQRARRQRPRRTRRGTVQQSRWRSRGRRRRYRHARRQSRLGRGRDRTSST